MSDVGSVELSIVKRARESAERVLKSLEPVLAAQVRSQVMAARLFDPYLAASFKEVNRVIGSPEFEVLNKSLRMLDVQPISSGAIAEVPARRSVQPFGRGRWAREPEAPLRSGASLPADAEPKSAATASEFPPTRWSRSRTGGMPLRGWDEICDLLEVKRTRNRRDALSKLNIETGGPIFYCGNLPEGDPGEIKAWIEDTRGREEERKRLIEEKKVEARFLGVRGGVPLDEVRMQAKMRPRGRAGRSKRSPPSGPRK